MSILKKMTGEGSENYEKTKKKKKEKQT